MEKTTLYPNHHLAGFSLVPSLHREQTPLSPTPSRWAEKFSSPRRPQTSSPRSTEKAKTSKPDFSLVEVKGGVLPRGSYLCGVEVGSFLLGNSPVTQEEWLRVRLWAQSIELTIRPNANWFKDLTYPAGASWYDAVVWCNAKSEMDGLQPVYRLPDPVYVLSGKEATHWENYDAFKRLATYPVLLNPKADGYRLPTEAEWEWAARGGCHSQGYTFSGSNNLDKVGWYRVNSGDRMHAPGEKSPNELGLYDMSGNISDWCWDLVANGFYHRVRGGFWGNDPELCAVFARRSSLTFSRGDDIGLRLARNL